MVRLPIGTRAGVIAPANRVTGRERVRSRTDRKLFDATMTIAMSRGVNAVTIEEVSRISGVAKTTIYRRFRNRNELLQGIARMIVVQIPPFDDVPFTKDGIETVLRSAIAIFEESFGVKAIGLILTSDTAFFQSVVANVLSPMREKIKAYFDHGIQAGVFNAATDVGFVIDCAMGGMVTHAALNNGIEPGWARRMAAFLWHAIALDPDAPSSATDPAIPGTDKEGQEI